MTPSSIEDVGAAFPTHNVPSLYCVGRSTATENHAEL